MRGNVVAENNGEILGAMMLKWRTQKRQKTIFKLSQALHYGWLTTIKLLVERFIFAHKPSSYACHVEALAVRPDAQGRGIGIRLLNYGKEKASKLGLKHHTLHVDPENKKAFNLYRKLGFTVVKKHRYLLARWLFGVEELYFMSQDITLPDKHSIGHHG